MKSKWLTRVTVETEENIPPRRYEMARCYDGTFTWRDNFNPHGKIIAYFDREIDAVEWGRTTLIDIGG